MQVDEVEIDAATVRGLVAAQFPDWADLPIQRVRSTGTDNAMFRLGTDLVARLPRTLAAMWQVDKEHRWLPPLAEADLPLAIPTLLGKGAPAQGYDWPWSIYRWLEGEDATTQPVADLRQAAAALGHFIAALHQVDPTDGPPPGEHSFWRGDTLSERSPEVREALIALEGMIDTEAASAAWDEACQLPVWSGPPLWVHGDLYAGNLLVQRGKLSAVIDFGALAVGDPACDVMVAWTYLSSETREVFRETLPVDEATWARGRGWALSVALIGLPYYRSSNPVWAAIARRIIDDVIADRS